MSERILETHRTRAAYVYVRQSSQHQVRHHREGRRLQYDLAKRARELGFSRVIVIDEDQGKSGSGLQERPGFGRLLSAVCQGDAGAVLALEASRLARNNRDWYHLVDLCALTETLMIDTDGVYDPRELNDRLLLGLKGSMAEFELGLLRRRAREAFEQKVRRGHAMWEMPVGFVRNEDDRIEKIPDRQVQQAITSVFKKFRELESGRQTMLWFREQKIPLPRARPGTQGKEVVWGLPTAHRIYQLFKNPCYAGVLAYGRTTAKHTVADGRARKASTRRMKPREEWTVFLRDNHPGYISWDEYLKNRRIMESNLAMRAGASRGAVKGGAALLAGMLRCRRCGRILYSSYSGHRGRTPRYLCPGDRTDRGSGPCLSLGGVAIERAVSEQAMQAVQPAAVEAAVAAVERTTQLHSEKRQALEMALEKARFESGRARRQYDAVDPDNRLVAGELERRWNETLSAIDQVEEELASLDSEAKVLTPEQQEGLFHLADDLPALWDHPSSSNVAKKRILRTVIHEIIVDNDDQQNHHVLIVHWQGGVHTNLRVPFNKIGRRRVVTKKRALDLIRELSKVCSDRTIAAILNRLGLRTGAGMTWRWHSIQRARSYHRLPNHRNSNKWLTVDGAAKELGVSQTVIRRLIRDKTLPATQVVETTPWIINRTDLSLKPVQADVQAVRKGRQLLKSNANQAEIAFR